MRPDIRLRVLFPWLSKRKATDSHGGSPSKKPRPDGDPHDNRPRAKPRISYLLLAPEEGHNVPRTLDFSDGNPVSPILCLVDTFEASVVLDCPRFTACSTMFRVFDEHNNTPYNMQLLTLFKENSLIKPFFISGWRSFVKDHNLGAGDQISFDKNLDTTISDDFYYILKYVKEPESSRKPDDGAESSRKPDDGAESSRKPDDGAESSTKPGDGAESSTKPGDGAESSTKLIDDGAESSRKPDDGAESRGKPGDTTESSKKPIDDSVQSVHGIGIPVFKIIYHRVLLEMPSDQQQTIEPRPITPGSRPFQLEAICLSKTLNMAEFKSWLYFDVFDAIVLTDIPRVTETHPEIKLNFMVSDRADRRYLMKLRHFEMQGGIFGFRLDGWDRFLMNHDFKRGDRVAFYKFLDRSIRKGYFFVVLKLPADVDCQNRRNPCRPGSRTLMPGSYCFSKILSQNDVSPEAAGLQLDTLEARHFESSSRSLNELFLVYDRDDRKYDMKLSYCFNIERELIGFLDIDDWHLFVVRNNLGAGDMIHVSKTFDQSVCADHYFVIAFTRTVS